ncbi:MAG: glycosyltransferase family 2 protein [Deltaproteobacteria bacterium]|nr:glycosyltransferase family 2 protein [Deltaproteobacteria bacterium]
MKVSVIIPAYDEIQTIDEILARVEAVAFDKEIVVVDDCSRDGTRERLREIAASGRIRVVEHAVNQGKGAALRTGFKEAQGEIVVIQDADLEYDPNDLLRVIKPIQDGIADVSYGSRFIGGDSHRVLYFWHSLGNRMLTLFSNMLTDLNLTDMEVCYKAFRREIVEQIEIEEDRFGFEPEITAKVARLGARIYEVGIAYHGRTYEDGKKIGWRDGVRAVVCILKYNVFRR